MRFEKITTKPLTFPDHAVIPDKPAVFDDTKRKRAFPWFYVTCAGFALVQVALFLAAWL